MYDKTDSFIAQAWKNETLAAMENFIRVPSLSPGFDKHWEENKFLDKTIDDAIDFGKTYFPEAHFERLCAPGRSPSLFFDIPANEAGKKKQSVLVYGHLDKQPPNSGWDDDKKPFEPTLKDGKLYGRGAADDGYSVYCAWTALKALKEAGAAYPRTFGLIETCEESGSLDLPYWLELLRDRFDRIGLIAVLDAGVATYDRMWVTTSFRGIIAFSLKVAALKHGIHSGLASGIVPETFTVARELLSRIEESQTGHVLDKNCYATVPTARLEQLKQCSELLGETYRTGFPWLEGVRPKFETAFDNLFNQTWAPHLSVIGIDGMPAISDAGNVLRAQTTLKLSFRIPSHVDAKKAFASIRETLLREPPFGVEVSVSDTMLHDGWDAADEKPWFNDCLNTIGAEIFGKPPMFLAEGGSIPILNLFGQTFSDAQFLVTGVLGPHANAHGPNEMLELSYVEKLTRALARFMHQIPEATP